ncbi:MAG: PIG-L family deacetylase [Mangrovibacterium sp.]|nr:PIG-L family deacetylase [Mangrovibacterium sp.]
MEQTVLSLLAHPDDAEFVCAGTLSLLKKAGWKIHIATMTPGDKGSAEHSREEISRIRKNEAARAAQLLDATYHCLELEDIYILYNRESINKATSLIREVRPSIVFTSSPADYMIDHEITALVTQTACFSAGIKNLPISETSFEAIPWLYYCDPMEGKDKLGNPVKPGMYVDITSEMQVKQQMLACHESQRNWLLSHHKMDEYLLSMKRFSAQRGQEAGVTYAEGFRQHLGHGYPQDHVLKEILGEAVLTGKQTTKRK